MAAHHLLHECNQGQLPEVTGKKIFHVLRSMAAMGSFPARGRVMLLACSKCRVWRRGVAEAASLPV